MPGGSATVTCQYPRISTCTRKKSSSRSAPQLYRQQYQDSRKYREPVVGQAKLVEQPRKVLLVNASSSRLARVFFLRNEYLHAGGTRNFQTGLKHKRKLLHLVGPARQEEL
jgi:hypothetical protein